MLNQKYTGLSHKNYSLGQKIGQGGEGAVFLVQEHQGQVIKIYSELPDPDKIEKLIFMTSIPKQELLKFAAWPEDVVRDNAGRYCGIIMRKLDAFVPLHKLFSPMDRKQTFADKGYNFLVHVATNLAAAFHKIHEAGIIIGDVNEANILVNQIGMVALIDCDSFQIKNGNRYHFCEVGIPRYTPPELLRRGSFDQVVRTANTDNFSLATLIFQLLFLGRAPFTGINPTGEDLDEETAIKTHEFAYSLKRTNKKLLPAKNSLTLNTMTSGVSALFHASFEQDVQRPSAFLWVQELSELKKSMVQCSKTKIHFYPNVIGECPWCNFRERANILYFLDDAYLKTLPELNDINQFIQGFKIETISINKLRGNFERPDMKASKVPIEYRKLKWIDLGVFTAIILLTLTLCMLFNWGFLLGGLISMWTYHSITPTKRKLQAGITSLENAFEKHKKSFHNLINQHNRPPETDRYQQIYRHLSQQIDQFKRLPEDFETGKRKIEMNYYQKSLDTYLSGFDIRNYAIPSFGSSKKLLVYTNGIRTAADVSKLSNIKIAGIGPKNIQILIDWQRQISAGFTYLPEVNAINRDISQLGNNISAKKQVLEMEIKKEYKTLMLIKGNILATVKNLEPQYEPFARKVYQAKLDLDAFRKLY